MKKGCEGKNEKKTRSIELPVLAVSSDEKNGIRKSKKAFWRAVALGSINLLIVVHIIQWLLMGKTVSPIEPSEAMFTLQNGAVNAGFIFFTLAILATLIFGRFVCGWGCHFLALQDLCGWLLQRIGLKPKPFRSRLLIYIPLLAAFYMFIFPTLFRFIFKPANEPLFPAFTTHLITEDFWATFPSVWVAIPFFFICGCLTVYFLGQKGFCTYACPYGGFFGLADQVAPGKIRVTDACRQCGHCTAVCTSNVLVGKEVKEYGMVVNPGCMKCMDCVSVCPNEALYFGFGKPSIAVKKTLKSSYSLTWTEEILGLIVFFASFFAVWNVYQLVPMLMALGIAAVTTYVTLFTLRFFQKTEIAFYRYAFKTAGKIQTSGGIFLVFAVLWLGLTMHSGVVRYFEAAGNRAFDTIRLPNELALAQKNPATWLNTAERQNIEEGKKAFYTAKSLGFFTNSAALPKLAWLEFLAGNPEKSIELLETASENQSGSQKALSLYYRSAILNLSERFEEAVMSADKALEERPDLVTANEEKGEALWQLGRRGEAIAVWEKAVKQNPNLPLATHFLLGAGNLENKPELVALYQNQVAKITPPDPYFYWMLGLRLKRIGMNENAEKYFQRAVQLNPNFRNLLR